ncbi:MAG: tetratricopeptide repeat protein [Bryobacteraceae bacterium]|nr:tetratricopeptide repeat protein [Bryobacteraceae bacterium]
MKSAAIQILGVALLLALIVYAPSLGFGYLPLKDGAHIYLNDRGWDQVFNPQPVWQPVTWISHLFDASLLGPDASGRRLENLFIHLANMVLLFLFLRRATGEAVPAAMAAALFGLHPLRSEPVVWISQRGALLIAFWALLAAWLALRGQRVAAGLAAVVSVLAIPFPPLGSIEGWLAAAWFHGRETVWPVSLAFARAKVSSMEAALGAIVLVALAGGGFLLRSKSPVAARGLGVAAAAMVLFFSAPERVAHGAYLAHLGLAPALVWLIRDAAGARAVSVARAAMVLLLVLAGLTWARNSDFRDAFSLLTQTRSAAGLPADLQLSLAQLLFEAGRQVESEQEFRQLVKQTPQSGDAWAGLGNTLLAQKKQQEAAEAFREGTRRAPGMASNYYGLGIVETNLNRPAEARMAFEKALALKLDGRPAAIACNNMGSFLAAEKKFPEAQAWFERAVEFDIRFVPAHRNLALVLNDQGKRGAAINHLQNKALLWTNNEESLGRLNVDLLNLESQAAQRRAYEKYKAGKK